LGEKPLGFRLYTYIIYVRLMLMSCSVVIITLIMILMMMMMVMRVLVAGSSAVRSLSMQIMAWTGHGASLVVLGSHYSMGLVEKRRNRICIVAQWHATTHQPSTIPPPTIPTHNPLHLFRPTCLIPYASDLRPTWLLS